MTVREMLARMDSREYAEWRVLLRMEADDMKKKTPGASSTADRVRTGLTGYRGRRGRRG